MCVCVTKVVTHIHLINATVLCLTFYEYILGRVEGVRVGGVRTGGVRVGGGKGGGIEDRRRKGEGRRKPCWKSCGGRWVRVGGVRMGGVRVGGCIPQRSYQSVLVLLLVTLETKTRLCHCCL